MRLFTPSRLAPVKEALKTAKNIAIISHFNPDGDAVGSSLALYQYFHNEGFNTNVILPNSVSEFLRWMPGLKQATIAEKSMRTAKKILKEADILFIVDMNALHRSGPSLEEPIKTSRAFKVLIDHHLSPVIECNAQFSTTQTTSTCELVYQFLDKLDADKTKITLEVATCIYVGIITDTGSLSYMCNQPATYSIIGNLMKKGIDGEAIHRKVYDNYNESRIKLLGLCLSQRLKIIRDHSTTYMYLTKKDLKDNNYVIGDTEGFVNYGLSLKGIQFTAFFTERDDRIRVSFRSKGNFDVNLFARKHFNGGGHKNAAAAFWYDTLENTLKYFETILKEYDQVLHPKNFV
ncbi:MAG: DHH family phosphoesterase [Bacteroidales bacterium]|nr:DHH family phosphoesterase [Bacteroidales bacterium]